MHNAETLLARLRNFILTVFIFGALGTGVELLLLGHTKEPNQLVPLVLISCSLLVLIGYAILRHHAFLRALQILMILFMLGGVLGSVLHYRAKVEFKREMQPDLSGMQLFWEVMRGATLPPVLAPGVLLQLGLLGLTFCHRHPRLLDSNKS